jgi:hypothetical protein
MSEQVGQHRHHAQGRTLRPQQQATDGPYHVELAMTLPKVLSSADFSAAEVEDLAARGIV